MHNIAESGFQTLRTERKGWHLVITLDRPDRRNAMSLTMARELAAVFDGCRVDSTIRAIVLRGAGGAFCAGADLQELTQLIANREPVETDPLAELSHQLGTMLMKANAAPQAVIAVLEGPVFGGGLGLACVADVTIAMNDARFGLPESRLGLVATHVIPLLASRIGVSHTRRLAVTGKPFDGSTAASLGLVHYVEEEPSALESRLAAVLDDVRLCAPSAVAVVKEVIVSRGYDWLYGNLDGASRVFSTQARSSAAQEGTVAFLDGRPAAWSAEDL